MSYAVFLKTERLSPQPSQSRAHPKSGGTGQLGAGAAAAVIAQNRQEKLEKVIIRDAVI